MYQELVVCSIVKESDSIKSFYLRSPSSEEIPDFLPGQYITVQFQNGDGKLVSRDFCLSDSPGKRHLRITIKKEEQSICSAFFHDITKEGDRLRVSKPRGDFYLNPISYNPVILISAGIGIAPIMSIAEYLAIYQPGREIHFLHSSANIEKQPMLTRLKELERYAQNFYLSIHHTRPLEREVITRDYNVRGPIEQKHIKQAITNDYSDFYLCGPEDFMNCIYESLAAMRIPENRIYYETFTHERIEIGRNVSRQIPV